jgi:hypothetical protein
MVHRLLGNRNAPGNSPRRQRSLAHDALRPNRRPNSTGDSMSLPALAATRVHRLPAEITSFPPPPGAFSTPPASRASAISRKAAAIRLKSTAQTLPALVQRSRPTGVRSLRNHNGLRTRGAEVVPTSVRGFERTYGDGMTCTKHPSRSPRPKPSQKPSGDDPSQSHNVMFHFLFHDSGTARPTTHPEPQRQSLWGEGLETARLFLFYASGRSSG